MDVSRACNRQGGAGDPRAPRTARRLPRERLPRAEPWSGGSPDPIPNSAVKPHLAESTAAPGRGRTGRSARRGRFFALTSYEIASTEEVCFRDAHAGVFLFRLVSLHGARSAAGKKPPAMRVRVEGSALASKRRQSGYDTGVQVVSARKGGRFGKQGTQPVAHEVDVQVPHRVHTEV